MNTRKKFEFKKAFAVNKPTWWIRCFIMMFAVFVQGLGACLFRLSLMGNDPCYAFVLAFAAKFGHGYAGAVESLNGLAFITGITTISLTLIVLNTVLFINEIALSPYLIGIGTFFNWVMFGIFSDFWYGLITTHVNVPTGFGGRLIIVVLGVLVQSFGCAFYQTASMGLAPYDALSITLDHRTKIPYFWCRIIFDFIFAAGTFALGGILGIGTLISVFGMGPFVSFFTNKMAVKICPKAED